MAFCGEFDSDRPSGLSDYFENLEGHLACLVDQRLVGGFVR
jgi:hypothetical protein